MHSCGLHTDHIVEIEGELGKPVNIYPLGDIHREAELFDESEYLNTLGMIEKKIKAKELVYLIGMGDYLDYMAGSERQAVRAAAMHDTSLSRMDKMVKVDVAKLTEELRFTKGHWLGMLGGNHYWEYGSGLLSDVELADSLGAKFLGVSAALRLRIKLRTAKQHFANVTVDFKLHHGTSAPRTYGASVAAVQRMSEDSDASICGQGHDHRRFIIDGTPKLGLVDDGHGGVKLHARQILFFRSGGFLRGYVSGEVSYVADRGLSATHLGVVRIKIVPRRHRHNDANFVTYDLHGSI